MPLQHGLSSPPDAQQVDTVLRAAVQLLKQQLPEPFDLSLLNVGATNFKDVGVSSSFKPSSIARLFTRDQGKDTEMAAVAAADNSTQYMTSPHTTVNKAAVAVSSGGQPRACRPSVSAAAAADASTMRRRDYGCFPPASALMCKSEERQMRESALQLRLQSVDALQDDQHFNLSDVETLSGDDSDGHEQQGGHHYRQQQQQPQLLGIVQLPSKQSTLCIQQCTADTSQTPQSPPGTAKHTGTDAYDCLERPSKHQRTSVETQSASTLQSAPMTVPIVQQGKGLMSKVIAGASASCSAAECSPAMDSTPVMGSSVGTGCITKPTTALQGTACAAAMTTDHELPSYYNVHHLAGMYGVVGVEVVECYDDDVVDDDALSQSQDSSNMGAQGMDAQLLNEEARSMSGASEQQDRLLHEDDRYIGAQHTAGIVLDDCSKHDTSLHPQRNDNCMQPQTGDMQLNSSHLLEFEETEQQQAAGAAARQHSKPDPGNDHHTSNQGQQHQHQHQQVQDLKEQAIPHPAHQEIECSPPHEVIGCGAELIKGFDSTLSCCNAAANADQDHDVNAAGCHHAEPETAGTEPADSVVQFSTPSDQSWQPSQQRQQQQQQQHQHQPQQEHQRQQHQQQQQQQQPMPEQLQQHAQPASSTPGTYSLQRNKPHATSSSANLKQVTNGDAVCSMQRVVIHVDVDCFYCQVSTWNTDSKMMVGCAV